VQADRVEKELGKRGGCRRITGSARPSPLVAGWHLDSFLSCFRIATMTRQGTLHGCAGRFPLPVAASSLQVRCSNQTVLERMNGDKNYKPTNLPEEYLSEPWVRWGEETNIATLVQRSDLLDRKVFDRAGSSGGSRQGLCRGKVASFSRAGA